jgi:hypothetical protein
MRKLTWRDDYSDSAHFLAEDTIKDICDFYVQNKKAFTFTKTHISIELGNDLSCKKKVKSWVNTLPAEMQAKNESSRDCVKMVINRKEFEEFSGFKWKRFGVF